MDVKLIDFGTACAYDPREGMNKVAGTIMFMSPEMMIRDRANVTFDLKCDIWALGILTFIILSGAFPY